VAGRGVQGRSWSPFHDLAQIHHRHVIGDVLHHREVVGDEEIREAPSLLQVGEQVQDLGLDRHVEGTHGLVEHQELRLDREGAGDAHTLALPPRQLVRIAPGEARVEPDFLEQRGDAALGVGSGGEAVDRERLRQGLAHRQARIERPVGILKHDLHAPPQRAQLAPPERQHVQAVDHHPARVGLDQPEDAPSHRGFSATRFTHQAERLAGHDRERDVVHGSDRGARASHPEVAALAGKVLDQPLHVDERGGGRRHGTGRAVRRCGSVRSQQRTEWMPGSPVLASSSGGSSSRQRSQAYGQRG